MDFWQRARSFAEEAAKKSQELTQSIASTNLSDVVSEASKKSKELAAEASKKSKELAAEASKKSKELAAEALKRADQISAQIPPTASALTNLFDSAPQKDGDSSGGGGGAIEAAYLEKFGVTDELREFVKGITIDTFKDFPVEEDSETSDTPTVSNVRQDLSEWQERHAKLVLLTVKEISKLRYQLCPRAMKERKFWKIYFVLVNSHVAPYEKRYMEEKLKEAEKVKDTEVKEVSSVETSSKTAEETSKEKSNNVKPADTEQDLDVFLLGDLEDGDDADDGPDDGKDIDDGFDDDFDKI